MELTMALKCGLLLVVTFALLTTPVAARPPHRQKRVSDQRLAELETLLALAKMKNRKYVTLPVGYGLIDVQQIGRRKRSAALEMVHRPIVRDPTATDYELGDIIADWSNYSSSDSDSMRDEPILGGNYSDEEDPSVAEERRQDKADYVLGGLRPGTRALFLGMRPHQQQHPRFI